MNRTKALIVDTFWKLLEEKPYNKITVQDIVDHCQVNRNTFYYHFQDIPTLTMNSIERWTEQVIKNNAEQGSTTSCLVYMAQECTKRKKAFLHLYRSVQKDVLLKYLDIMGYRMICVYMENTEAYVDMPKNERDIFIRYYKCAFAGILLDWMENGASYDLVHFYDELCELFKKWDESTFFKPLTFKINE